MNVVDSNKIVDFGYRSILREYFMPEKLLSRGCLEKMRKILKNNSRSEPLFVSVIYRYVCETETSVYYSREENKIIVDRLRQRDYNDRKAPNIESRQSKRS